MLIQLCVLHKYVYLLMYLLMTLASFWGLTWLHERSVHIQYDNCTLNNDSQVSLYQPTIVPSLD